MEQVMFMVLKAALGVGSLFFLIWLLHIPLKNAGIVDVGWGMGFILICFFYIIQGEGFNLRNTILFIMTLLWGLRIIIFLLKRIRHEKTEDKRYQKIRRKFGENATLKFLGIFESQAALEMLISIPFLIVSLNPELFLPGIEIFGISIFALALLGETIADQQLQYFKKDPKNKGKVCDIGLWYYSRHPNYFFEWLIWVGFFIYGLSSSYGLVGIVSPIVMYILMMYVSGVPLAEEQSLLSRGDLYRTYQKTTSVFVPLPKKGK